MVDIPGGFHFPRLSVPSFCNICTRTVGKNQPHPGVVTSGVFSGRGWQQRKRCGTTKGKSLQEVNETTGWVWKTFLKIKSWLSTNKQKYGQENTMGNIRKARIRQCGLQTVSLLFIRTLIKPEVIMSNESLFGIDNLSIFVSLSVWQIKYHHSSWRATENVSLFTFVNSN